MVKKHYGRWLPNDTKSMAATVSQMMGFKTDSTASGGLEREGFALNLPQTLSAKTRSP